MSCGSRFGLAHFRKRVDGKFHVAILCHRDHLRYGWWRGAYISQAEFRESGAFPNAVPHIVADSGQFDRSSSNEGSTYRFKDWVRTLFEEYAQLDDAICFACGKPPCRYLPTVEPKMVYRWLKSRPDLYNALKACLCGATVSNWYKILHSHQELKAQVDAEISDSGLQYDHILPVEDQKELRKRSVPSKPRQCAARELGVPRCRACNNGRKFLRLEALSTLRSRVAAYWDTVDPAQTARMTAALEVLYEPIFEIRTRRLAARKPA